MTDTIHKFVNKIENFEFRILKTKMEDQKFVFSDFKIESQEDSRSLVIYGDNVSGKSLIGKLAEASFKGSNIPSRNACVRNRVSSGMQRGFVYGDESEESTGATSFSVIEKAFNSASKDDKQSLVILDEADLGLSPKFSRTLGKYVADYLNENAKIMLIIISHNQVFLDTYQKKLKISGSSIGINTKKSLQDWIHSDEVASLEELKGLKDLNLKKWRAIEKELDKMRNSK